MYSYEIYRKVLSEKNFHFTKLGHEECEICEVHKLHLTDHSKELITSVMSVKID